MCSLSEWVSEMDTYGTEDGDRSIKTRTPGSHEREREKGGGVESGLHRRWDHTTNSVFSSFFIRFPFPSLESMAMDPSSREIKGLYLLTPLPLSFDRLRLRLSIPPLRDGRDSC